MVSRCLFVALLCCSVNARTSTSTSVLAFAMSNDDATSNNNDNIRSTDEKKSNLPQLPPPDDHSNKDLPTLKFGETLKLDAMGPIILNTDGTTRRISNWDSLSKQEQQVSWRRIQKRNEERRQKLLRQQQQQQQADEEL